MKDENILSLIVDFVLDEMNGSIVLTQELSKSGWCIPVEQGKVELHSKIKNSSLPKYDVIEEFYAVNFLELIENELTRSSLLVIEPYKTTLNECIKSYHEGRYAICIPALFAIIESMLVFLSNDGDFKKIRYSSALKSRIDSGEIRNDTLLSKLREIQTVVTALFSSIPFDSAEKDKLLNRHSVMHGRVERGYTRADALKLFVLTAMIKSCYEN